MCAELYADKINSDKPVRQEMKQVRQLIGASGGYVYSAVVPAARPAADYTARVIPTLPALLFPWKSLTNGERQYALLP